MSGHDTSSPMAVYREFKRDLLKLSIAMVVMALLMIFVQLLAGPAPTDETDLSPSTRSGMILRTDHGTGCQYLEAAGGGITPRLRPDGKPLCAGGALR